jgi:hypothetical protein
MPNAEPVSPPAMNPVPMVSANMAAAAFPIAQLVSDTPQ